MMTSSKRLRGHLTFSSTASLLFFLAFSAKASAEEQPAKVAFTNAVVAMTVSGCRWSDIPGGKRASIDAKLLNNSVPYVGFVQQGQVCVLFSAKSIDLIVADEKLIRVHLNGHVVTTTHDQGKATSPTMIRSEAVTLDLKSGTPSLIHESPQP